MQLEQLDTLSHIRERGQSTIEFLMGFIIVFSMIFIFITMAFTITNGYLIHYLTFMASRTYLVFDNNNLNSDSAAENSIRSDFPMTGLNAFIPNFSSNNDIDFFHPRTHGPNLYVGVSVAFKQNFNLGNVLGGLDPVTFRSESFLGREPTRADCLKRILSELDNTCRGGNCDLHMTVFDNGC